MDNKTQNLKCEFYCPLVSKSLEIFGKFSKYKLIRGETINVFKIWFWYSQPKQQPHPSHSYFPL